MIVSKAVHRIFNFVSYAAIAVSVYLGASLITAAVSNSKFEGKPLGPVQVALINDVKDSSKLQLHLLNEASSPPKSHVIVAWATWCGPCHSLLTDLNAEVAAGRLDPSRVTAVSLGEPFSDVSAYLQRTPLPFRIALDRDGSLSKQVKIAGTPTVIFLDSKGVIQRFSMGGIRLARSVSDFIGKN